ncbi:ABC transporter permease [Halobium salinum]|uniref:ABC transporter permease n=1 Tax=Halobium salinum TaxID=1364940 RepID=A0ABD5P9D3_9EURY|nr:ABC transporter permease [Halobium salinum]
MIPDRLYRQFPTLLIARRNLTRTKARSALAMLGIVIGVLAIASLGLFGATLQQSVTGSLGGIGNELVVSPATEEGVESLTEADVREIRRVAGDASVVPIRQGAVQVRYRGESSRVAAYGMDNPGDSYAAAEGRIPDGFRSGVLVGASLADELGVRPGSSLTVGNRTYRVQAVLAAQQGFSTVNPDSGVVLPIRAVPGEGYSQVVVGADSGEEANATAVAIRAALNDREERVSIFELGDIVEQIGSAFQAVNLFLVGIGSISLLVAGVSILNVMLMSAIERREEIGVLRAVGYQKRDVLKIMLSEALLLGVVGGVVGAGLSVGGGLLISQLILGDALAALTLGNALYVVAAFGFAIVTSVLSGLYPAYKAANEEPVEALRS